MTKFQPFLMPIGRLFIALIFLSSGIDKIGSFAGMQGYMEAMGLSGSLLGPTIAFEIIVSLMIVAGYQTRLAAFSLAGFSLVTALVFHFNLADQMQYIMFMKNIAISGGFLVLGASGAGFYSVDHFLGSRQKLQTV